MNTFKVLKSTDNELTDAVRRAVNMSSYFPAEFQGRSNQATASGATPDEAERQARTTACGPIAHGMDETIACTNRPPVRRECRTL